MNKVFPLREQSRGQRSERRDKGRKASNLGQGESLLPIVFETHKDQYGQDSRTMRERVRETGVKNLS
jgi:hypothetical protein